jgi:hypothetical protein
MSGLAWVAPATRAVGDIVTGSMLNVIRDELTFLANVPLFYGYQATAQSVANATFTGVTLDTNSIDTYGGHSTTVNNTRYTPPQPGYYQCAGVITYAPNATGGRIAQLFQNGVAVPGTQIVSSAASGLNQGVASPARSIYFNGTTDYVELYAYQSSGGALSLLANLSGLDVRWVHI